MCYPKPGPRCAGHIAKSMDANAVAMQEAQDKGDRKGLAALKEQQSSQWNDFCGTKSGQKVLQEKIYHEDDPDVRESLENYREARRNEYLAKVKLYHDSKSS